MLSGYRPRLGSCVALCMRDGDVRLAVPSDEVDEAALVATGDVASYSPGSLDRLTDIGTTLAEALQGLARDLPAGARVGFEDGPVMTPNAYVSTLQLGASVTGILNNALPAATLEPASDLLRELCSRLSEREAALVTEACGLGEIAFTAARAAMRPGAAEFEIAAAAGAALAGSEGTPPDRGGQAWVMSGPNSALAYRAFATAGSRRLQPGDLVLVHMNPQVGGFWSDLTRTFVLGDPDTGARSVFDAVFAARSAALAAIKLGVPARDVDAAARATIGARGFEGSFKHQTGHGVGLNGISGSDTPALHPLSTDVLAVDMCFNVEPSIYLDGVGGCRHCDVVRLGESGPELLSPYLATVDDLIVVA